MLHCMPSTISMATRSFNALLIIVLLMDQSGSPCLHVSIIIINPSLKIDLYTQLTIFEVREIARHFPILVELDHEVNCLSLCGRGRGLGCSRGGGRVAMSASIAQAAHGGVASLNLFSCTAERERENFNYGLDMYSGV